MNRNRIVAAGLGFVCLLIGCRSTAGIHDTAENQSVIVRRTDNKGDEAVRIYIDGRRAGRLSKGEIRSYNLPKGDHSIYANYDGDDHRNSEILYFTINNNLCRFSVEVTFNERNRYSGIKIAREDPQGGGVIPGNNNAIDEALEKSFAVISENIPERTVVAIVNISSEDAKAGEYAIEELTLLFVNSRKYDIVDRRDLDIIRGEQNFQMTGEVDDNSILSIGHLLGAGVVITGRIDEDERLRLKVLDVKTAKILAMSSEKI
ncbi:MAG: CsgG/HfaB family protein [Treponema sp.]|jgi:hypothetical protein|nr:CsgG/HfaB family protein [Treponema sp.]